MFRIFVFLVCLSPLPFGANRDWSANLFCLCFAGLALFSAIGSLFDRSNKIINVTNFRCALALFLVPIIWAALQASSWVPNDWVHPIWFEMQGALLDSIEYKTSGYISVDPYRTKGALARLLSYGLVFFLSAHYCRRTANVYFLWKSLSIAGFLYATYGLIIYFGGFNKILWFDKWAYLPDLTSTFVNRNSFATYVGLTLLCCVAMTHRESQKGLSYGLSTNFGKEYFVEKGLLRLWLPALSIAACFTALLLTHSRGGFISTVIGLFCFIVIIFLRKKGSLGYISFIGLLVVSICYFAFILSGDLLMIRFDQISLENSDRLKVYATLLHAIQENFWRGVGYGTFENSFRLYRESNVQKFFDTAHNTYLENIFELGFWQALSLFCSVFFIFFNCLKKVFHRNINWIYLATAISATVLVAVHSLVDFSLQIPAITFTYTALLGGAYAQSLKEMDEG